MLNNINKPKIGWVCSYVPQEIIYAAGLHSYRLIGDHQPINLAEIYLPSNICPFVRNCIETALRGEYDFLDGVIMTNSCQACEFLYDVWDKKLDTGFVYMLDVPRKINSQSIDYFKNRLKLLIETLEKRFETKITNESLIEAAKKYNKARTLLGEIYDLRKLNPAPITSVKMLEIINKNYLTTIEEYNNYLQEVLDDLKQKGAENGPDNKKRILLMGSKISHPQIPESLEDELAVIVCGGRCSHHRPVDGLGEVNDDIIG